MLPFSGRQRGSQYGPRFESLEARHLLSGAGTADPIFGGGPGGAIVPVSADFAGKGPEALAQDSIALQRDGKVLVAGTLSTAGSINEAIVRLNPDGLRDTSFGRGGQVLFAGESAIGLISLQSDGKIVVAGTDPSPTRSGGTDLVAERFNGDGSVDLTYGSGGVARFLAPGGADARLAQAVVDSRDDLVLAADAPIGPAAGDRSMLVVRITPTGEIDPSFGQAGIAQVAGTIHGMTQDVAGGLAIQADGKIVLAGSAQTGERDAQTGRPLDQAVVARLGDDGTLDPTFGPASATPGMVTLLAEPGAAFVTAELTVRAVVIDRGKILIATNASKLDSFPSGYLCRLDSSGAVDGGSGSYGTIGLFTVFDIQSLAVDSSGRIVVGGTDDTQGTAAVARFNPDCTPDPTFGARAVKYEAGVQPVTLGPGTIHPSARSVAVEPDGSILLAGGVEAVLGGNLVPTFAVARLEPGKTPAPGSPGGTPDANFGPGTGSAIVPVAADFHSTGPQAVSENAVATQADGKILLAGSVEQYGVPHVVVVRLDADGTRDVGFGSGGEALFTADVAVTSVLVQANGKILVVGGTVVDSPGVIPKFFAVRFDADGTLDATYGTHGVARFPIPGDGSVASGSVHVAGAVLDPETGNLVIAGDAQMGTGGSEPGLVERDLVVARLDPEGVLDRSFARGGIDAVAVPIGLITQDSAAGVTIELGHTIVVGGSAVASYTVGKDQNGVAHPVPNYQAIAIQLCFDGSLDVNFGGTSQGKVVLPTEETAAVPAGGVQILSLIGFGSDVRLAGIKSTPNGPIGVFYSLRAGPGVGDSGTVFGDSVNGGESTVDHGSGIVAMTATRTGIVAAVNADGTVDFDGPDIPYTSFGSLRTPGSASIQFGPGSAGAQVRAATLTRDGNILLAGQAYYVLGGAINTVFAATELVPVVSPASPTTTGLLAGQLDPGFAQGAGTATVSNPMDTAASVTAEAIQPDGKLILAGKELARLLPDGTIDPSFGVDGKTATPIGGFLASSVFVLPGGEIEVFGYTDQATPILLRYTASGQPDRAFGGDGQVKLSGPGKTPFPTGGSAASLADGKLMIAGGSPSGVVAIRVNADGSIDASFGTGGVSIVNLGSNLIDGKVEGVVVQPDGRIVIAGNLGRIGSFDPTTSYRPPTTSIFAIRLNADGSPDLGFGGPGQGPEVVLGAEVDNPSSGELDSISGVAMEPDGHLVLGGSTGGDVRVTVLNPDGTLDLGFGHLGVATVPGLAPFDGPVPRGGVVVEPNAQIVVAATVSERLADQVRGEFRSMLAARFNTDGTLDQGFGNPETPGIATYLPGGTAAQVNAVVVRPDGDVLLAGFANLAASGTSPAGQAFAVARVNARPIPIPGPGPVKHEHS